MHGYNTTFKNAALRTAQLGLDLGISGVMAFYRWPSKGTLLGYAADAASIEASEGAITDYLTSIAALSGANKIHIIAHSIGNRALLRAVSRIAAAASERSGRPFTRPAIVHAEIWPGVVEDRVREAMKYNAQLIRDRAQVLSLCQWAAEADEKGLHETAAEPAGGWSRALHSA